MKILGIVLLSVIGLFALILLFLHIKSRRPFRSAAVNALLGIAAVAAVNLTASLSGVRIPLNVWTVPFSAAFGIPGVCTIVIFQTLL